MTKTLHPIKPGNLRHAAASQFLTRFLDDLTQSSLNLSSDEVLPGLVERLRTAAGPLARSLEQVRASSRSAEIAQADDQRDRNFQTLKDSLRLYHASREEAEKIAYTSLKQLLVQHKVTA